MLAAGADATEVEVSPTVVEDPKLAAIAQDYAERAEPLPEGRSGVVTAACRAATIHRILTGKALDPTPLAVVGYSNLEEER